jgi:hypothetical protein
VSGMQQIKGEASGKELVVHGSWKLETLVDDDDVIEFDLDEEVVHGEVRFLAMAHYYSRKKFNTRGLFEEMKWLGV